jgi:hypothetical protein
MNTAVLTEKTHMNKGAPANTMAKEAIAVIRPR